MSEKYPSTLPYDVKGQWREWGPYYESWFVAAGYAEQERVLTEVLTQLDWETVLDVGCGFGRLGMLIERIRPEAVYMGIDVSPDQLASARRHLPRGLFHEGAILEVGPPKLRPDLVTCSEVLMHQPHEIIEATFERLFECSFGWVVSVDCYPDGEESSWCFMHDYPALYGDRLVSQHQADLQTVFVGRRP